MAGRGVTGRPPGSAPLPPFARPGTGLAPATPGIGLAPPQGRSLPPVPGLKVRLPLCIGFVVNVAVRWANSQGLGGVTTDTELYASYPTLLTPAPWGFWVQSVIDTLQGFACIYAVFTVGYRTNGTKERLVRIAGACWPFAWLCAVVVQWCCEQQRMIASALFAQGVFAGSFVAVTKLLPLASKCSPVQRWAFVTPSAMQAAWATLQSCLFFAMVPAKHGDQLPAWSVAMMALACTGIAMAILIVPLVTFPQAPPLSTCPLALAWGLAAAAVHDNRPSLLTGIAAPGTAAALGCCAAALACAALGVSVDFVAAKARGKAGGGAGEATPLMAAHVQGMAAAAADSFDALEQSLLLAGGGPRGSNAAAAPQRGGQNSAAFPPLPPHPRSVLPPVGATGSSAHHNAAAAVAAARGGGTGRRSPGPGGIVVDVAIAPPREQQQQPHMRGVDESRDYAGEDRQSSQANAAAAAKLRLHAAQQAWHDARAVADASSRALQRAQGAAPQPTANGGGPADFYRGGGNATSNGASTSASVSPAVAAAQAAWHAALDSLSAAESEVLAARQALAEAGVAAQPETLMFHGKRRAGNGGMDTAGAMSRASSLHMGEGTPLDSDEEESGDRGRGVSYPPSGYADAGTAAASGTATPAAQFPVSYGQKGHPKLTVRTSSK